MQPLLTKAVSEFQSDSEFKGTITVSDVGSAQGIADLMDNQADIAASDISPTQTGLDETGLVDHQIAVLAVAVVVSPDISASLTNISVSDLRGIYTGAITDWTQVAGWKVAGMPISVYYQRAGSGIRTVFETYGIMTALSDQQLASYSSFSVFDSSATLTKALQGAKGAIGYAAMPFCSEVTMLQVEGVQPSYENVYTGKYKIWACQHLYTKGEPTGPVKSFLDFLSNEDFQESVAEIGYGLISEMKVSR
ncbi:Phosphate-binding protein PstS 1 [bioreactor metagenome]|uniref:Phosphate-binding protein PstS 1 n=1 Tax=bioreactor metagenome TaxID=1076179 RepID=A0A645BQ15_9ZZZZ